MKNITKVFLREYNEYKEIAITDEDKPCVEQLYIDRWQKTIDLIAKIFCVPAALIMQVTKDSMKVFLKSNNPDNPYHEGDGDNLGCGLYCESVLGTNNELLIDYAMKYENWKDNPDVSLNMISYYGLPIKWPDDEFFGTICVLDNKTNSFEQEYKDLLFEFKLALERDLELLCYQNELLYYAEIDMLTSSYNRRKIEAILKSEFERAKRYSHTFSVTIMDINDLKFINDRHGHIAGDDIIKTFANGISSRIRETDFLGRWGGDEFVLICPNTDIHETEKLLERIKNSVEQEMNEVVEFSGFCYGISKFEESDNNYQDVFKRADVLMYKQKGKM